MWCQHIRLGVHQLQQAVYILALKFLPSPEMKLAENHGGVRISVAVLLQRVSFYYSNNYITLKNLITRKKSGAIFSGSTCGSGFSKKKTFFSMKAHR